MFRKSLQGGALYLAIFISLVIAVLLSMLLLQSFYSTLDFDKFSISERVHRNLLSGYNYAVSESFETEKEFVKKDLFEEQKDSVDLVKKWWGCYQVVGVRSHWKGISESILCLAGTEFMKDTALVLTETDRPVSVAGKTILRGTCFLPRLGVRPAYIGGEGFMGDK